MYKFNWCILQFIALNIALPLGSIWKYITLMKNATCKKIRKVSQQLKKERFMILDWFYIEVDNDTKSKLYL